MLSRYLVYLAAVSGGSAAEVFGSILEILRTDNKLLGLQFGCCRTQAQSHMS